MTDKYQNKYGATNLLCCICLSYKDLKYLIPEKFYPSKKQKTMFLGNAEAFCVVCSFAEENADERIEKVKYDIKYVLCIIHLL